MKKYINKWLSEGLISAEQAQTMQADIEKQSSEKTSKKIIFTFSTIGAVLAGIGFILFVASNWQVIPSIIKIAMLAIITFSAAFGGYYLAYVNKKYPKTGASLLFLSTLLFGALIFLTAQVYHIESSHNLHTLIFLWLISIIPYIYIFESKPVTLLSIILFFIWFNSYIIYHHNGLYKYTVIELLPLMNLIAGLFLFNIGKLNSLKESLIGIGKVFEKIGIFIIFLCLFLFIFPSFIEKTLDNFILSKDLSIFFLINIILFLFIFFINPSKTNNTTQSFMITFIISFCIAITTKTFSIDPLIISNLFFVFMLFALILSGYQKKEMFYVNLGIFWLIIFIIVKYFDLFWDYLPRSLFFLTGGIILIISALFFEHKRRDLKMEIKKQ